MDSLLSVLESILFVAVKPVSTAKLATVIGRDKQEIESFLQQLAARYQNEDSGLRLIHDGHVWQLVTAEKNSIIVKNFLRAESLGELTRPALETLTVIAYRGPVTKSEIETIRGVNCSLILRNLMIRSLIEEIPDEHEDQQQYRVTLDFLKYIGLTHISELPDFEALSHHHSLEALLLAEEQNKKQPEFVKK